ICPGMSLEVVLALGIVDEIIYEQGGLLALVDHEARYLAIHGWLPEWEWSVWLRPPPLAVAPVRPGHVYLGAIVLDYSLADHGHLAGLTPCMEQERVSSKGRGVLLCCLGEHQDRLGQLHLDERRLDRLPLLLGGSVLLASAANGALGIYVD